MSRGVGTGGGVWYDGYQFQGKGVKKDVRHEHASIHPTFRSSADDLRRSIGGGFGWTSSLDSRPMNRRAKKGPNRVSGTQASKCVKAKSVEASVSTTSSSSSPREKIRAILKKHNPSKLSNLPTLLKKWEGREDVLLERMRQKFRES